jgi:hypothetical protein
LANYLAGKRSDASLDRRIDQLYHQANDRLPDRDQLEKLSNDFSLDFSALYLADRITRAPVNRRFRSAFDQAYDYTRHALSAGSLKLPAAAADYELVFVPSYLYKRYPDTGADFAAPRAAARRVGLRHGFVETDEDGAIEENADLVANAIREHAHSGRRLILVSASKSGAEVALALTRLGAGVTRHVVAWVNIVGALQGTPLADKRVLSDASEELGKVDTAGMESLTTARSRQRFHSFHIPESVLVVNYIGIPFTGSISSRGGLGFSYLRNYGPNDGITLLADSIFPRGVTLAELGRDHFLLDYQLDVTTVALAITVIRWLESEHSTVTRVPPS